MNKYTLLATGLLALAVIAACVLVRPTPAPAVNGASAITSTSLQARLGQEVSGLGVTITPIAVLEDSRCPSDVQCIQAGTVKLKARVDSPSGTTVEEFKLGEGVPFQTATITLTVVAPEKTAGTTLENGRYLFSFFIARAIESGKENSRCGGFIKDAPTCATGYHCQLKVSSPDTGGICVAD